MTRFIVLVLAVLACIANTAVYGGVIKPKLLPNSPVDTPSVTRVPTSDGLLHFYVLPIGQGDSHVIQCPNGDLAIVDLGTAEPESAGFWVTSDIVGFLQGQYHLIKTVVITHYHADHYSFLPTALTSAQDLSGLANIHVSCTRDDMAQPIKDWITSIQADDKIRLFNNGQSCGPNGQPCGQLDLCPGDPSVNVKVLAANMDSCANVNRNIDSVIFKITHDQVSIMFNGDFGDYTNNQDEDGPQKAMVDFYGEELKVTVYKLAHHSALDFANKRISCAAHAPKAVFVSGNPDSIMWHPRCDVIDRFQLEVQSLCKPLDTNPESEFYCGEYPLENVAPSDILQQIYTCGESGNGGLRYVTDNEHAIYTTVPNQSLLNIIKFTSDGVKWGFTNNIYPKRAAQED